MSLSFGGDDRTRTDYLYNAIVALSQVSYAPDCLIIISYFSGNVKCFFEIFLYSRIFSKIPVSEGFAEENFGAKY